MDVDRRFGIVAVEETFTLGEMCIETGLLLREISLIQGHTLIGDNDGADDLGKSLIPFRESLKIWADTGKAPEFDPVLPIAHLLKLRVDAFLAEHGCEEGALGLEELPKV